MERLAGGQAGTVACPAHSPAPADLRECWGGGGCSWEVSQMMSWISKSRVEFKTQARVGGQESDA